MRTLAAIGRVLIWVFTVLMLFFQIGTAIAIKNYDTAVGANSSFEIGPMVIITALMFVTVIVFFASVRVPSAPLTFIFPYSSMYFETGSSRKSLPSSTRRIAARQVMTFVAEKIQ